MAYFPKTLPIVTTNLGSGRTGLTKFVWFFQKSRQNLSLPNFQFVKCGHTKDIAKYLLTTSVNRTEINTTPCALFAGKVTCDFRSHVASAH